ncbi:uncharacterized protein SPSC_05816 [Sporisorium scitamineum]|uniref:Uncharacterized protein n=1 Tax=Sporisorium scitamineum TaxID=49012 RepID=A0A0F7RVY1_9BASI|nr:hypothetical protein [Sporisorium scitamineum]CDU25645.1 uncharacterized protein SPSC_05816 [Sporisorium scitamineum]
MPPPSFSHQTAVVLPRAIQSWLKDIISKIKSTLQATDEAKRHSILSAIETAVEEQAQSLQAAAQADEGNHPAAAGPSPTAQIRSQISLRINDAIQNMLQTDLEARQADKLPALVDVLFVTMPLLGPTSIVMEWWDLVLCPLLKNASVQNITANRARELVVRAMITAPSTAYEDEPSPTAVWPAPASAESSSADSPGLGTSPRRARAAPYPMSAAAPLSLPSPSRQQQRSSSLNVGLGPGSRSASVGSRQDTFRRFTQRILDLYLAEAAHENQQIASEEVVHRDLRRSSAPDVHKTHSGSAPGSSTSAAGSGSGANDRDHAVIRDLSHSHVLRDPGAIVWKGNLESILLVYSNEKPKEFFHHIAESFSDPTARVPLLFLLSTFLRLYPIHAYHITSTALPRMLMLSLQLDTSTTCVSLGVTAFIMLIPHIPNWIANGGAGGLPTLLSIFARIVDWRRLGHGWESRIGDDPELQEMRREKDEEFSEIDRLGKRLNIKPSLRWNRLESSFDTTMSTPPNAEHLFTFLYGLYPCNVIRFLRSPIDYLRKASFDSPFEGPWEDMMDEVAVQNRSGPILRRHTIHPAIITMDAETELTDKQRWLDHDSADINAECLGLFLGKWHDVSSAHIVQAESQRRGSLNHEAPDDETASVFSSEARLGPFDMDRRRSAAALMHPFSPSGSAHRHYQKVPGSVNPDDILLTYASLRSGAPLTSTTAAVEAASIGAPPAAIGFGAATQPMTAAAQRLDESAVVAPMSSSATQARATGGMTASGTLSRLMPAASAAAAATPAMVTAMGSSSASHVPMSMPASPATHASLARIRSRSGSLSSLQSSHHSASPATPTSPTSTTRHPLASSHLPTDPLTPQQASGSSEKAFLAIPSYDTTMPTAAAQGVGSDASVISLLQRENLLLRNELNFELYLKEQHLRHIGRLHREKVTDTALEAERQNLYHTVRTLRASNAAQHAELERCRAEAAATKARHVQWEADLNNKLKAYREERKAWTTEARQLKAQAEEDAANNASLTRQLEESGAQLFELKTKMESDEPKLARIEQYEAKNALLTECLAYWDDDVLKYEQQRKEMEKLLNMWDEMAYSHEATEAALSEAEDRCATLEAENERLRGELEIAFASVKALKEEKGKLVVEGEPGSRQVREEIDELERERDELRGGIERLSAEVLEFKARMEAVQVKENGESREVNGPHGGSGLASGLQDVDVPPLGEQ